MEYSKNILEYYKNILEYYKNIYGGSKTKTFSFINRPKKPLFAKQVFPKKKCSDFFIKRNRRFLVMRSAPDHFFDEKLITRGSIYATF